MPQMQETWSLHSRLSSWDKELKKKKYKDYSSDDARRRRNRQSLHHQNPRSLHLTRREAPRRLGHSLAKKWILRLNLRIMRKRRHPRSPSLVWQAWLLLPRSSASLSSTLKKMATPTMLMKAMMTTLPPIASWQRVPR